jgi:hypothetical protein
LQSRDSTFFDFSLNLLPEDLFGTEEIPEYILSDSSTEEENATHEQKTNHQLRRRIRHLEHDRRDITARCNAECECRMSLEALVGGKIFTLFRPHVQVQSSCLMIFCSSSSDVSNRYNNLKATWDSLMEVAKHASPQGFHVAVTVVLERLKREELKRKNVEMKK